LAQLPTPMIATRTFSCWRPLADLFETAPFDSVPSNSLT
jgi:hypothetical protein